MVQDANVKRMRTEKLLAEAQSSVSIITVYLMPPVLLLPYTRCLSCTPPPSWG